MWPFMPLGIEPETGAWLTVMFAASLVFVLAVFVAIFVRVMRERREFRVIECPDDRRRALIVVNRAAEGSEYDAVTDCSRWHGGKPPACEGRCLASAAEGSGAPARFAEC